MNGQQDQVKQAVLDNSRIVTVLMFLAFFLSAISLFGQFLCTRTDMYVVVQLAEWFDVDFEGNLPAWYSTILLALAGLVCYFVAKSGSYVGDTKASQWYVLSALMTMLSVDEGALIHEKFGNLMMPLELSGPFFFAWVIPYSVFVVVAGIYFLPFLKALPMVHRRAIIISGVVFVAAALGIEFIEGSLVSARGEEDLLYESVATVQECLEMVGVILFLRAILAILASSPRTAVTFSSRAS